MAYWTEELPNNFLVSNEWLNHSAECFYQLLKSVGDGSTFVF